MRYSKDRPTIYQYGDYRNYVSDMCSFLQKSPELKSFHKVSVKLGFKTQNFLKMVISGKRNLSSKSMEKLIIGFDLNRKERRLFENMVGFDQAETIEKKAFYSHEILRSNINSRSRHLEKKHLNYLTKIHSITLREMVNLDGFKEDYKLIAKSLVPKSTATDVEKIFQELIAIGYLKRDQNGKLIQSEDIVSTGDTRLWNNIQINALRSFHKRMAELAVKSIEIFDKRERNISGVTVCLSKDKLTRASEIMARARKELLDMELEDDGAPSKEVYRINLQLFPLTKWSKRGKK